MRLFDHGRGAGDGPTSGIVHAAFLREGRAHREALGRRETGHVVVVLAHGDLAGLQGLLELPFVAVPELHVRLQFGQLFQNLQDALLASQDLLTAEVGLCGDLQQEGVGGQGEQPQAVPLVLGPHVGPGGRRLGEDVRIADQRDVPGHRADAVDASVRIGVDELVEQVFHMRQLGLVERHPEFRRLPFQHRRLRHHVDVGRRPACPGRLFELNQPGFAGRLGHRLHLDAGRGGEVREDELVEGVLEVAAVDADLQRLGRASPDGR